ncbi:hypothetical protein, partial [Bradyrhizobium sp.]|uniref:hypothetical protein n=1 Tax=Bradyrhizobium sp. TaxID=376 RepID=UPI003C385B27
MNPNQIDPRDVRLDAPDTVRATRADGEATTLAPEAVRRALDAQARASSGDAGAAVPPVDTTFRPAADHIKILADRGSVGRRVLRGVAGFVFTVCFGVAVVAFQSSSYGVIAKQTIAKWAPQFVPASWMTPDDAAASAEPNASTDQAATASAPAQQTASAQPPADAAQPAYATLSPDVTQLLQSMAHDLATVQQGIEQLKASQDQSVRDNAKAVEQLRASQEQLAHLIARATAEQNRAARLAALPRPPTPAGPNSAFAARRPV